MDKRRELRTQIVNIISNNCSRPGFDEYTNSADQIIALFPEPSVEEIREKVFQALGQASMCWDMTPVGVFDSSRAKRIGEELITALSKLQIKGEGNLCKGCVNEDMPCAEGEINCSGHIKKPHPENGGVCCCGGIELKEGTKVVGNVAHCKTKPCYITDKPLPPQECKHEWEVLNTGSDYYKCKLCGASKREEIKPLPPKPEGVCGHKWGMGNFDGIDSLIYRCSKCFQFKKEIKPLPPQETEKVEELRELTDDERKMFNNADPGLVMMWDKINQLCCAFNSAQRGRNGFSANRSNK